MTTVLVTSGNVGNHVEIESFRGLVPEHLGLHFEHSKLDFLADALRKRMEDTGCSRFAVCQGRIPGKKLH